MTKIDYPHRGLGRGTVLAPPRTRGSALIVEVKGFLLMAKIRGVIDTADQLEQGDTLCYAMDFSRRPVRGIVPSRYTHVSVEPTRSSRSNNGIHYWRLGFRTADDLPPFTGTVSSPNDDVFHHRGPAAWGRLETGRGYVHLYWHSVDGTQEKELTAVEGPYRGRFQLPGPGLIRVSCLGTPWSATIEGN